MIKYIMILVVGLSVSLPVAVQAGSAPPPPATVVVLKCCMDDGDIVVASTSANGGLGGCAILQTCAVCIQACLDLGLDLEQINVSSNVEDSCSWYHFFDNDRRDSDR